MRLLLTLVFLLPFNAAGSELESRRAVCNVPACVSIVRVAKNVIVRNVAKPEAFITEHNCRFTLIEILVDAEAYLSWPYRGSSRKWIGGAPGKDIIFGRAQGPKQGPV